MKKDSLEEQLQLLQEKVFKAEEERLSGAKTISISEARKCLKERVLKKD